LLVVLEVDDVSDVVDEVEEVVEDVVVDDVVVDVVVEVVEVANLPETLVVEISTTTLSTPETSSEVFRVE